MKKLLFLSVFIFSTLVNAQVQFEKFSSLSDMLKAAKKQHKSIFIDAYTDWCGWCKVLDKEVFADKVFADTLHKYFIPVKLEMEKDSLGVIIARKYGIRSFPIALILNEDGRLITQIKGYSPIDAYTKELQDAIEKTKAKVVVTGYSSNYNLKYPDSYLKHFPMPSKKREKRDSVQVNNYLANQNNWNNEIVWLTLKTERFILSTANQDKLIQLLPDFAKSFGESEAKDLYIAIADKRIKQLMSADELVFIKEVQKITQNMNASSVWWYDFNYKLDYYKNKKDYNKVTTLVDEFVNSTHQKNNVGSINEVAWELYQSCNDTSLLNRAIGWMQNCVLPKAPLFNYIDTYAALLYKTGKLEEAKAQAKLAIKIGKVDGEKTTETEKLLGQIETALKNRE